MARKLTKQQQRQVAKQRQTYTGTTEQALVLTHFGKSTLVETANGQRHHCQLRQHLGDMIAGDLVNVSLSEETPVIVDIVDRRNTLTTPVGRKSKLVGANLDHLFIVIAPEPQYDTHLIDRYLIAATLNDITPVLVYNKIDLSDASLYEREFELYQSLNYPVLFTSATEQEGLAPLTGLMAGTSNAFIGQSGVGKSSLSNALIPDLNQQTKALTPKGHGSHTTSNAVLFHLPEGGQLIDSPGMRDFALWPMSLQAIERGFIEFGPFLGECQFNNCSHAHEPRCAIKEAVASGAITQARFNSFHRLCDDFINI